MKQRMIYSSCPYCGHDFQILRDTYEIAGMNPVAEKRLQDESYFLHQCNSCKKLYYLQYPFMYRDPKKKYIILLSQQEEIPDLPKDEKIVRIKQAKQFPFVYKVLKNNLDLKRVFEIRRQLQKKYEKDVKLDSFQEECLWFIIDEKYIGVSYDRKD